MPRIALLFAFASSLAWAQAGNSFTVSGTVFELGSDGMASLPVAGAEVTLYDFVQADGVSTRSAAATVFTDPRGTWEIHPQHEGFYYLEVNKEGYRNAGSEEIAGVGVELDQNTRTKQQKFILTRTGAVTGRVVDEEGKPVANLRVTVLPSTGPRALETPPVTEADGTFTAAGLLPGPHVVRIASRTGDGQKVEPRFSPGDLDVVDQDFETAYWPGGTAQPTLYVPVGPGNTVSVGTIQIRTVAYYRVHVSVPHVECAEEEQWAFLAEEASVPAGGGKVIPCAADFLVSNLRSGSYAFTLRKDKPAPAAWALSLVNVSKNTEVAVTFEPEARINGRLVPVGGGSLPAAKEVQINSGAEVGSSSSSTKTDAEGKFVLDHLMFPRHRVAVQVPQGYYVKEMRLNGAALAEPIVSLTAGGANQLDVVVDDKPGTITETVMDGDNPAKEAEVLLYPKFQPLGSFLRAGNTDSQGRFHISGLPPGEYGILAIPLGFVVPSPAYRDAIARLAANAPNVTVERGGTADVTLPLVDPSK